MTQKLFSLTLVFFFLAVVITAAHADGPLIATGVTYEVGPGKPYANVGDVPWESLGPGDTVLMSDNAGFLDRLTSFSVNELAIRILVLCFFMIFGSHAQHTIFQRRKTDEALQLSEKKQETILESMEDGYYETDLSGKLTFINDAFSRIANRSKDDLVGVPLKTVSGSKNAPKVSDAFNTLLEGTNSVKDLTWAIARRNGSKRYAEATMYLIKSPNDETTGFRGLVRDVTKRILAEKLQQEKMAAETASKSKSEFLANMSHEIRTPLNSVIGLIELTLGSNIGDEQREDLKVAKSAAYSLLSVINDILDFSKIEAGKLELDETDFSLRDFLGETLKIMAMKAAEKNLELAYRVAPDIPDQLIGDPVRFRQIILNLVGNAIKFTQTGEIVVSAEHRRDSENKGELYITVRDTGIGIPPEKQEVIFGAFDQADSSTTRQYGGTGLGLAVSSQLVELMGGSIKVKSQPGQGSTFHFTARFGLGTEIPETQPALADINLAGMRVLVVDDNATIRDILKETLASWQMFPLAAADIETARQTLLQRKKSGLPFDIALIDSALADSDGFDLVRWINEEYPASLNLVMMLTSANLRNQKDFEYLGIKASVIKPVRPSDLLDAIMVAQGITAAVPESPVGIEAQLKDHDSPPLRILVAEDTPFNQKYITSLLKRWGFVPTVVNNGRLAFEALDEGVFDIVLMDIQMPEMDGFEATREIRKREKRDGGHVPIVAMTVHAMKGDRERCIAAGMDDYISKPISQEKLLESILTLKPEAPAAPPVVEKPPAEKVPEQPVSIDKRTLLEAFGGDIDFLREVAAMFIDDYPAMLKGIEKSLKNCDGKGLRDTAHSLKGMLRSFAAETACKSVIKLEEMGHKEIFEGADQIYNNLAVEVTEIERALRTHLNPNAA